jgi:hypothetical protein
MLRPSEGELPFMETHTRRTQALKKAYQTRFSTGKGSNNDFEDQYRQYIVFYKEDNKDKCNKAFKALVLDITVNNDFEEQDFNCFLIIFGTLSVSEAAFVSAELANKACAHLLTAPIDATDPATEACAHLLTAPMDATEANLFVYNITAKSRYTFTVFIRIMVNINVFKKSTAGYGQFQAL